MTLFRLILHQSYLHILSYLLVSCILIAALADAFLIAHLRRLLRIEGLRLKNNDVPAIEMAAMTHPAAVALTKFHAVPAGFSAVRRAVDGAEAALFIPLRARMSLTRDLSTLMGLIATLLALVAAATEFARHGKPELLVGSVGTGCIATCVAAVGCAIALWNLSKLTRLRVEIDGDSEEILNRARGLPPAVDDEVPIQHVLPMPSQSSSSDRQENYAPF